MGHGLQQFLPLGRIIDLGEFLRQIQVISADHAILDEPFAGLGHLGVWKISSRAQRFPDGLVFFGCGRRTVL